MPLEIDSKSLITAIKKRTPIYDWNLEEYNDRSLKKKLWIEVCEEIFTPAVWKSLPKHAQGRYESEVQRRWLSLRHCFRRELIKQNTSLPSVEGTRRRKKYVYFDDLQFILRFIKTEKEWTENNKEKVNNFALEIDSSTLITEVKNRAPLYNSSMPEYNDRELKNNLWIEVSQKIFTPTVWESLAKKEQRLYANEVQKKWINLRHCFRRELGAQIKRSSLDSVHKQKRRKYIHYDELEFLLPFSKIERTQFENETTSVENDGGSTTEMSDNEDENMIVVPVNVQNETSIAADNKQLDNGQQQTDDELFLRSLIPHLNDIPSNKKLELRMEIIKLVLDFKKSLNTCSVINNLRVTTSVKIEPTD